MNPAADSILARQMISALYVRDTENARPLFVSITSKADIATSLAFPIGTEMAATTKVFNEVPVPGPGEKLESERQFYTHTPGHDEFLINHVTIDRHETINSPGGLPALEENLLHNHAGDGFVLDAAGGQLAVWQLKRIGDVDVPYWNVKVDPSIIKNHGDLWNERAEAMMAAIFRMANPMLNRNAKPRAVLQRAPDRTRLMQQRQKTPRH